jgi:hypothetical protein
VTCYLKLRQRINKIQLDRGILEKLQKVIKYANIYNRQ